jgi:hypothetical protein
MSHKWKFDVEFTTADDSPTEGEVLDALAQGWAMKAADALRAQLESASIKGRATSKAALDDLLSAIATRLSNELISRHWNSERVRDLFPEREKSINQTPNIIFPDYDVVQRIVRDDQGRAEEIHTKRTARAS